MLNPVPTAFEATIEYGEPATVADDGAPALVRVTLVTASPLTRVEVVNSVPANVNVSPKHLLWLFAVIVNAFGVIAKVLLFKSGERVSVQKIDETERH